MIRDKKEFQQLEDLVQQIYSVLMLKSASHFSDDEKALVKELFGSRIGGTAPGELTEEINEIKEDNDKLYFEIRQGYGENIDNLKK